MNKKNYDSDKDIEINDIENEYNVIDNNIDEYQINIENYINNNDLDNSEVDDEAVSINETNNDIDEEHKVDLNKKCDCNCKKDKKKTYNVGAIFLSALSASLITGLLVKYNISNQMEDMQTEIIVSNDDTENISRAVAKKAIPSVVGISSISIDSNNILSIPQKKEGIGSGIIVDSTGYILTNSHVIQDGGTVEQLKVHFNDGDIKEAKVLWTDAQLDLAILKVNDKTNLVSAKLGDSENVEVGDNCYALGNPLGLEFAGTLTKGIISGKDREVGSEKGIMSELIQTDASINPGNSGGPLLNNKGEVIGINTAKISNAESLGLSIPINTVKPIIEQIIKNGNYEKVTLGIKGMDVEMFKSLVGIDLDVKNGVYVLEIMDDSSAKKGNINVNDIIVQMNDKEIKSMNDLNKELYTCSKGQKVNIIVLRNGEKVNLEINF